MLMRFPCPHCQYELSAPSECAGRSSQCRNCGGTVTVPIPKAEVAPPVSGKPRAWLLVGAIGGTAAVVCLLPFAVVGGLILGGFGLWWAEAPAGQAAKQLDNAQVKAADAEPKKEALDLAGIEQRTYFTPDATYTSPKLGTLRTHPWWKRRLTDREIESIIFSIAQLPIRQELLFLTPSGEVERHEDNPPSAKGDVCAILFENDRLDFYGARAAPSRFPTRRQDVISMLSQGLDADHASTELRRRTGKGFSQWEQFEGMGDIGGLNNVQPLPKAPGPAIGVPKE
jgi:hypothetical protein